MNDNKLSDIIQTSMENIRSMVDSNTVIGQPITTANGTVVIPVSKVFVGFASGGTDFSGKNAPSKDNFGGGAGAGVKIDPVAFLVIKDGFTRVLPVALPPKTTVDRIVDMAPDLLDKVEKFSDKKEAKKQEEVL